MNALFPLRVPLAGALLFVLGSCAGSAPPPQPAPPPVAAEPLPPPVPTYGEGSELILSGTPRQGGLMRGAVPAGTTQLLLDGAPVALARDGRFLIAFDRDAPPVARLRTLLADGRAIDRDLAVAPGNWRIERVNAPLTGGAATTAEFKARRTGELEQIAAARALRPVTDGWRQSFIWPLRTRVSGVFGSQRIYRGTPGSYHSGLDMAAPAGTPFVAPADGVVVLAAASPFTLEGNLLIIDHGMGLSSAFLHCSRLDVKLGDVVRQGQVIAAVGATGRASGPHLHWGLKWNDARIDPLPLLPH